MKGKEEVGARGLGEENKGPKLKKKFYVIILIRAFQSLLKKTREKTRGGWGKKSGKLIKKF